jgi:arylsulfatase A-like enzyme
MQGQIPLATDGWMNSVISPRWQMIEHEKHAPQIYDWRADPGELHNLADSEEGREAIRALESAVPH